MSNLFRKSHLLSILTTFSSNNIPLDVFLRGYFKSHKSIGAQDRKYIAETVYNLFRWLALVDYFCDGNHSWEKRLEIFNKFPLDADLLRGIPNHLQVSFPKKLFDFLERSYGLEKAMQLCLASNTQAPITIRVNTLKTTRDALISLWKNRFVVQPCRHSPLGITFSKRENFFGFEEFAKGFFEVQDEGSQILASLVEAKEGQQVLDYCSGSGGKTLAFAPFMNQTGQIYLHDIRPKALGEAKKRLARAGIQNAQLLFAEDEIKKKRLFQKMDWVLVDAPCSGTGTLRRNPDMKWKIDTDKISDLVNLQRDVFKKALYFLKPGGTVVYGTCSILPCENQQQTQFFCEQYDLELVRNEFVTYPIIGEMDGFYGAVMKRKVT